VTAVFKAYYLTQVFKMVAPTEGDNRQSVTAFCLCKWVPVTTALRVLRLRMEERFPIWRVAANILNKQSRTADKGWSSSLRGGRGANNASPSKSHVKKHSQGKMLPLETKQSGGKLLPSLGSPGGGCFWRKYHAASKGKS
jgi:hypothetical protein